MHPVKSLDQTVADYTNYFPVSVLTEVREQRPLWTAEHMPICGSVGSIPNQHEFQHGSVLHIYICRTQYLSREPRALSAIHDGRKYDSDAISQHQRRVPHGAMD
jgi:hypothetical protein